MCDFEKNCFYYTPFNLGLILKQKLDQHRSSIDITSSTRTVDPFVSTFTVGSKQ